MSMLPTMLLEVGCLPTMWHRWVCFLRVEVIMIFVVRVIMMVADRLSRILKSPINSIWQPSAINKDWLALVHHRGHISLTMAVKLNNCSIRLLLFFLSCQTVFCITDVKLEL